MKVNMSKKELVELNCMTEGSFFVLNGNLCILVEHIQGKESKVYNFNEDIFVYVYEDTKVEYISNKNIEITVK